MAWDVAVIRRTALATAVVLAGAVTASAEIVAREAVSAGRLVAGAPVVAVVRADARSVVGAAEVVDLTVLECWKGGVSGTLRLVLRQVPADLRAGDELVAFLTTVPAESLGFVAGTYYAPVAPWPWALARVTDASRDAWRSIVAAHLAGDRAALARRLVAEVGGPDDRLSGDAVVDLWWLAEGPAPLDLALAAGADELAAAATTILSAEGRRRFDREMAPAVIWLGRAGVGAAVPGLFALAEATPEPDVAVLVGQALHRIAPAVTRATLAAALDPAPAGEPVPAAALLVRRLQIARGTADPELAGALRPLMTHADAPVRGWALVAAGECGAVSAEADLIARLDGGPPVDAPRAAWALHRIGTPAGLAALARAAESHPDPDTRVWLDRFRRNPALVGTSVLVGLARGQ